MLYQEYLCSANYKDGISAIDESRDVGFLRLKQMELQHEYSRVLASCIDKELLLPRYNNHALCMEAEKSKYGKGNAQII